jgi:hypothetical protein
MTLAHDDPRRAYELRRALIRELLDCWPPEHRIQAVLAVAAEAGVAVCWFDRASIETYADRELTEQEWARVKDRKNGFDEWMSNSGAYESMTYWITEVLLPKAGVVLDD